MDPTAARVRAALHALPIPAEVSAAVVSAWRALSGHDYAWAVRSSATAEDLPSAAGPHGVVGVVAVAFSEGSRSRA